MHTTSDTPARRAVLASVLLATGSVALSAPGMARAGAPLAGPPGQPPAPPASLADFDFFMGEWTTRHHRLVGRLVGSTTWQDFDGRLRAQKIQGGQGNMDDGVLHLPAGTYWGTTIRFFDPAQRTWSIYWLDSRDPKLDSPMVGGFDGKRGLFYGDDTLDGRPVKVRFLWQDVDPTHCRWEQAFWDDKRGDWETNWIMQHTRVG